jgi:SAM-dependent MidA family methyltransferase
MARLFSKEGECVSFEAFMNHALHDPQIGYYARSISTVGRGGDFTTTAEIAPSLAKAIAAWLVRELRASGCRDVIELGPGSGALSAAVRRHLPLWVRWRVRWHLVETSASLREVQKKRASLRRARWHDSVESALAACEGAACLYSNEFFDAFPVRLFQRVSEGWKELHFRRSIDALQEVWLDASAVPPSSIWRRDWKEGQRIEVHESVQRWLETLGRCWRRGAMLTIDYGAAIESLYHRQPAGTVRGYFLQQRITGPDLYRNIGRQDLTADVNFTDLIEWSSSFASAHSMQSQRDFLLPWVDASHPGDVHASDALGAGEAFRVWQCRVRRTG